ncbi:MAG: phosphohydrolase [Methanolinea sp. SDB]|nr:MAG: phosphohydrolase [Methanolinea sp. SDB]
MSVSGAEKKGPSLLEKFRTSENKWVSWARELAVVAIVVGAIALGLFLISGTWPAVVTIESESMVPHMNVGDLVFVVSADRYGDLQTWKEGQETGYMKFEDYGDVIIYKPNGATSVHPIIHRAMVWAEEGQTFQVTTGNLNYSYTAPHAGYITKGDNNAVIDQTGWESGYRGLGPLEPVRDEWLVGKALFAIPLLGYLPLHIVPVAIILIAAMFLYEYYIDRKKSAGNKPGKKQKKKK